MALALREPIKLGPERWGRSATFVPSTLHLSLPPSFPVGKVKSEQLAQLRGLGSYSRADGNVASSLIGENLSSWPPILG